MMANSGKSTNRRRTAVITGGSRGIGLAIARELANSGIHVVLAARDQKKLAFEVERMRGEGNRADYIAIDFRDSNYMEEFQKYIRYNFFEPTILVNGLGGGFGSKTLDNVKKYNEVMHLNFFVATNLTQYISEFALSANFGRFIYLGTLAINQKSASAPYVAAKSALMSYMKVISKTLAELDNNILAAAVSPGAINVEGKHLNKLSLTDSKALKEFIKLSRISSGRLGLPEEVAKVAAFLCGEDTNYLHGCNIEIDGGASN